jgi:hypothetical protein
MTTQSVTLHLPAPLYQRLKRRAEQARRPVEDELLDLVVAAVPVGDDLPTELTEALQRRLTPDPFGVTSLIHSEVRRRASCAALAARS